MWRPIHINAFFVYQERVMGTKYALKAGWLIDGTGTPAQQNVVIHIDQGTIAGLDTEANQDLLPKSVLDFSGHTVIPGLVDSHVHLAMSGATDPIIRENQLFASYEKALPVIKRHMDEHLACGVVAIRDGGDWGGHALQFSREHSQHPVVAKCAGKAWRGQNRYGKLVGRAPQDGQSLAQAISENAESPDFIKIVGSGLNSLLDFGKQTTPQFSLKELAQAVEVAKKMGLDTMVHANGEIPVQIALEAGCQSIEHGFFMGRDNLERMAQSGTMWVPTAVTMESYARSLPSGDPKAIGALKNLDHQLEQISLARKLGVTLAVGTDAGSTGVHHGRALSQEMALFVKAGFLLEESLKAATYSGSQLIGRSDSGVLTTGQIATLVVVKGSPHELLQNLNDPVAVIVDGKILNY